MEEHIFHFVCGCTSNKFVRDYYQSNKRILCEKHRLPATHFIGKCVACGQEFAGNLQQVKKNTCPEHKNDWHLFQSYKNRILKKNPLANPTFSQYVKMVRYKMAGKTNERSEELEADPIKLLQHTAPHWIAFYRVHVAPFKLND